MFNRSYQLRSTKAKKVREAGGGHQLAADAAARLPWAGIFEKGFSKPWRPLVVMAAVCETGQLAGKPAQPQTAAVRCKKRSRQLQLFDGKLRGVQLELFSESGPDIAAENFTARNKSMPREDLHARNSLPKRSDFHPAAELVLPMVDDDDRPLADLFPEAYL